MGKPGDTYEGVSIGVALSGCGGVSRIVLLPHVIHNAGPATVDLDQLLAEVRVPVVAVSCRDEHDAALGELRQVFGIEGPPNPMEKTPPRTV